MLGASCVAVVVPMLLAVVALGMATALPDPSVPMMARSHG
jgi:hypothetical protein